MSALSLKALALGQSVVSDLHAVIVVISVHRVIASADHRDLTYADLLLLRLELRDKIAAAPGRSISSVEEAVDIYSVKSVLLAHLKNGVQVSNVAVNAAVGQKSVNVQIGILHFTVVDRFEDLGILKEYSVLDLLGDPCKFLINDPAGAHIHVTDLGIAHLPVRESYRHTAGISLYKRNTLHKPADDRSICHGNSVSFGIVVKAIAIQDH